MPRGYRGFLRGLPLDRSWVRRSYTMSLILNYSTIRWVQDLQSGLQSLRLDAVGEAKLDHQEFSPGVFSLNTIFTKVQTDHLSS